LGLVHWQQHQAVPAGSDWQGILETAVSQDLAEYRFHGFARDDVRRWAWPQEWVVLVLMAWGLWRTFRRGWRDWARCRPPLTWALLLYVIIDLVGASLHPGADQDTALLALASLAVVLAVFGIADVLRGFMERLVLAPPQEREE
jgi:hypothetical protein